MTDLVHLRAEVAMREEDLRIARKHRDEAAARPLSGENVVAYRGACEWADECARREQEARARLIYALQGEIERGAEAFEADYQRSTTARMMEGR